MKVSGKQQKEYFDIFEVQFNLGFITVQWGAPLFVGFTDSDWIDNPDDRNSTLGYVFSL